MTRVGNFRAIIMDSNYQRIKQYEPIVQAMIESVHPFDCYYVAAESQLRTRPIFFKWLTMGFEEIRSALKQDREPNFNFLLDRQDTDIYQFAVPQLIHNTPKEDRKNPNPNQVKKTSLLTQVNEMASLAEAQYNSQASSKPSVTDKPVHVTVSEQNDPVEPVEIEEQTQV